jgi:PAS domain S-box-containing protein
VVTGDGEMATRIRTRDWSATPVGAFETWSTVLRTLIRTMLHSRQPMFLWWGPELVQFYNDAYVPSFGKGKHPLALGQPGRECWGEIWPIIGPQIEDAMQHGVASWHEHQLVPILRNGRLEEVYWTYGYSPVFEDDGRIAGVLVICNETTREVVSSRAVEQARQEAEQARARLAALFQNAPALVCTLTGPQHVFEIVNQAYQRMMGMHRVLLGKSVKEAVPEVVEQGFIDLLDGVYRTGRPFVGRETRIQMTRGYTGVLEDVYVTFIYQPRFDFSGTVEGIDVFGFEVTEQVIARQAAQAAVEANRNLAEAIPQQVWTATAEGQIDFGNQRVLDYFDATSIPVLVTRWLEGVHPEDQAESGAAWRRSLELGKDFEVEIRLRRADGEYRWHLCRAIPIRSAEGRVLRWFGTNTDIDDARRTRDELRRRTEFEQQLVGVVSHDLRNPLSAMMTTASMLMRRPESDERTNKALSRIVSSGERASRMIRDLLDFTHVRLGQGIPVQRRALNLHALTEQMVEEARVSHPGREIVFHRVGGGQVEGDADRLAQVVSNLLNNALQYGVPGSPVQITTSSDADSFAIEVRNKGNPIPPDLMSSLFEPMRRGSHPVGETMRSIGLGLFIVDQIVRSHGGVLDVRSTQEEGTVFTVRLPQSTQGLPKA